MKTKISAFSIGVFCAIIFLQSVSFAQWTSRYINNINGNYLRRIQFVNSLNGYTAGGNGTLIKTTDGGDTWNTLNIGTTAFLTSIYFLNPNTGWVAGFGGFMKKTTDAGNSWITQTVPNASTFANMLFFNELTGYIAGAAQQGMNQFAKTINGGTTWNIISTSTFAWGEINFVNQLTGWVEAPDYFAKTTDGGISWTRLLYDGSNQNFYFLNDQTGWVASEHIMKKTINGGFSWSFYPVPIDFPYGLKFFDQNTGWCVGSSGSSGVVCKSTDGGINWNIQKVEPNNAFYDASFINASTGWISGKATVVYTTNGGLVSVSQISTSIPSEFSLKQNYPNPFNPATKISFDIKNSTFASLKIFDMTGKEIKTLVNENIAAGSYEVNFNASELNSGVYFYTLKTNEFTETKKMMLVK